MIKTTVLLCSANRPEILNETVQGLFRQSSSSINILISAPDEASVPSNLKVDPRVEAITDAPRGLCCQRNAGIARVSTPYILFVDDDVELRSNYITAMEALFDADSTIVLSTAQVIADGVTSEGGINREQARQLLGEFTSKPLQSHDEAYGCNMFVRTGIAKQLRFDEVLPLYGWLEDYDFSIRCRQLGRIVLNGETGLVHLGTTRGRTSDVRLGYSQIANPYYIWQKLSKPSILYVIVTQWVRYIGVNAALLLLFWVRRRGDRAQRLEGNFKALSDLLVGRIHPGRILTL